MNLAEGGAFFVLDKSPINQPLGFVDGYGVATDYYHMTQPHPSGAPMALSMQRALMHAGWDASSVSYVNAHGTGTKANDSSEATAIASVFADSIYYNSTKALHGHTLAAAGALEAAITADGLVSGTFFVDERLSQQSKIPTFDGTNTPRRALSNSFGFGGHNVTLALSYPGGAG